MRKKGQAGCPAEGFSSSGCSSFGGISMLPLVRGRGGIVGRIDYYQQHIDPELKKKLHVKRICKYHPTCSCYAKQAVKKHGTVKGLMLTAYRLMRCNPFSRGGYDPVR